MYIAPCFAPEETVSQHQAAPVCPSGGCILVLEERCLAQSPPVPHPPDMATSLCWAEGPCYAQSHTPTPQNWLHIDSW